MMTVSLCIVAYNEEQSLPNLLEDFQRQTYPHNKIEIVLVDSGSSDSTKQIMEKFKNSIDDFIMVKIVDNPKKVLAAGWNKAIIASSGEIIIRIDAHARIPDKFVEQNVKNIEMGESIVGGARPCLIQDKTSWNKVLLQTENSLFGSSINISRRGTRVGYVKTLFHAAYRREVFMDIGGFNENLKRTEDNEIHYRMRQAGYRLYFDPQIQSYQFARNDLIKMIRQKYGNGYWIGLTTGITPHIFSLYHFIPAVFVLGIIFTTCLSLLGINQLTILFWGLYLTFGLLCMVSAIQKNGFCIFQILMPFLFLILHVSYGIGTLLGILKMPFIKKELKRCPEVMLVKNILNNKSERSNYD